MNKNERPFRIGDLVKITSIYSGDTTRWGRLLGTVGKIIAGVDNHWRIENGDGHMWRNSELSLWSNLWSNRMGRIDNKKFKVGDKVRLLSTSGAHQDWYEEHGYIGQVFTVIPSELTTQSDGSPHIFNNNDWDYVVDCPHRLGGIGIGVREHNLELVFDKQLNDEIRKAVEAEWAGCRLAPRRTGTLTGLNEIINNKENKEMNIVTYAKLNKDQRTLYKANIVDANGALTDSGRNVLLDMLANEPATQTKLAAMAKEFKKDQKED